MMRKPVWLAGAAVVGFSFYSASCSTGTFAFGARCRTCSEWECPIGQVLMHIHAFCARPGYEQYALAYARTETPAALDLHTSLR